MTPPDFSNNAETESRWPNSQNCMFNNFTATTMPINSIKYAVDILEKTVLRICFTKDKMKHFCIMRQGISILKTSSL